MSRANRIALIVIGLLLVAGIGWYVSWFLNNHERHYSDVLVEISPEARRNKFLAAEHYLRRTGMEVESVSGRDILANLPPVEDALLIGCLGNRLAPQRFDNLVEWLKQGGRLIVTPPAYWDEDEEGNALLEELGVRLMPSEFAWSGECIEMPAAGMGNGEASVEGEQVCIEGQEGQDVTDDEGAESSDEDDLSIVLIDVPSQGREVTAAFRGHRYLEDVDDWASWRLASEEGFHLLQYPVEHGVVTVLSDLDLFRNEKIGEWDHAYLLSELTRDSGKAWLLYSTDMPSLPELLWRHAPFIVVLLAALLLAALWRMLLYTGPRLLQERIRRNLLEHIDATAEFGWRVDRGRQLFENNRSVIEQAWRKRHPGLNGMEIGQRCEWIGEKSGLTANAVYRTLYGEVAAEQDFIKATMVLQRLVSGLSYKREQR
ncbi:DUF4350 domain-containing protein [Solemya velesiana gill symbiont]|uniref:DUF4350 domain-containing protein n=1 Tax=Solemya velesiana gill symbiont TaxID=1918948 RepID=A0A1T2KW21_9GAMM|nr:DUF4350 domain-containing protein [Solemya velesiana gill symbiont]OOZ37035.1 hypothetical protein BOW51_04285 [Solemya velesiana gill symbiont]